jgi:hypothetical protein
VSRDFVWLQVTNKVSPESPRYCARISDPNFKAECMQTTQRPHLHDHLAGDFCPNSTRRRDPSAAPGRGPNRGGPPVPGGPARPGGPPPAPTPGSPAPGSPAPTPGSPAPDAAPAPSPTPSN